MNRKLSSVILFSAILAIVIIEIVLASDNGKAGYTASPGETNCRSCHNSFAANTGGGTVTITSDIPNWEYSPNTIYTINVTISRSASTLFGFGFEALTSSNANAGTLSLINSATTRLLNASNGRKNVTHNFNGGNTSGSATFTFKWTAPSSNIGDVTFYTSGLASNKNTSTSGDYVYTTSQIVKPFVADVITVGNINGSPFCINQTGIKIPFASTGTHTTGNTFNAELSDVNGNFSNPTVIGTLNSINNTDTIVSTIPIPTTEGNLFKIRVTATTGNATSVANLSNLTIKDCSVSTITTSTVSGSPFCSSTSLQPIVNFTTVGMFAGSFKVQLSDINGSFNSPTIIGSGTTSPIIATIPNATIASSNYRIRVVNPSKLINGTDNGTNLQINTCLEIDSVNQEPFCSNTTYNLNVPFSTVGQTNATFFIELSDSSGSFINGGTVIGMGNESPIAATIPSGAKESVHYRIRVRNNTQFIFGTPSDSIAINTCGSLGFSNSNYSENLIVYPNPSNGNFTIGYNFPKTQEVKIDIIDLLGNIISKDNYALRTSGVIEFKQQNLTNGIYFLKISGETFSTVKIITVK